MLLSASTIALCRRPLRGLARVLRWGVLAVIGLWLLLLGVWFALHALILPNVDRWRPEIEAEASKALGASLRIGAIEVQTGGWIPVVRLRDLRLQGAQVGAEPLVLPEVTAALSARSLLTWPPRLEQIYLHQPVLEMRRDAAGRIWVAGQLLKAGEGSRSPLADWVLRQHELAIRGGHVRWIDETRPTAPPLVLGEVDLVVRNGLREHGLRLDATPPPEVGGRMSVRAEISHPLWAAPSDWRRWSGRAYTEWPAVRVPPLRAYADLPFELQQGEGRLRAWAELRRGAVQDLTLDLGLRDVHLRLTPRVEPLDLQALSARLVWQRLREGSRWSVRDLRFAAPWGQTPAHQAPNATLELQHASAAHDGPWAVPGPQALRGGRLQVDVLDLGLVGQLATRLPLGEALHQRVVQHAPQGLLRGLDARWQGPLDAPNDWALQGRGEHLGWRASPAARPAEASASHRPPGLPGVRGAFAELNFNRQGGEAKLVLKDGALEWPGLLMAEQWPVAQAQAELRWQRLRAAAPLAGATPRAADAWNVQFKRVQVQTPEADLRLSGSWRTDGPRGAELDLQASAPRLAVPAVVRHLPQSLPLSLRRYLGESLQAGELRQVDFTLRGPLADFPFRDGKSGRFRVAARAEGLRYAFVPSHPADPAGPQARAAYQSPWPALEGLGADLRFDGASLAILRGRARSLGLEIPDVEARIDDLQRQPTVQVKGQWRGAVPEALRYVRATPVNGWTAEALGQAQGAGAVNGRLELKLPLDRLEASSVRGQVQLQDVQLRLLDSLPSFQAVRGSLSFTEQGLQLGSGPTAGLQARFLGGAVRLTGGGDARTPWRFEAQGQASAQGLREAREWPQLAALAQAAQGSTDYQFRLGFREQRPEWELRSSLQGLGLQLPEPLNKPAGDAWPLLLRTQPQAGGHDAWGLSLASPLPVRALLDRAGNGQRGLIRVGGDPTLQLPVQGLHLQWTAPLIDLDAWRRVDVGMAAGSAGGSAGSTAGATAEWPDRIQLQTPVLKLTDRRFTQVQLSAQRAANRRDWQLQLQSTQAAGRIDWRPQGDAPGFVGARLQRLAWPRAEAERADAALEAASSTELPALDLQVDDFEWRGKRLGSLRIQAEGALPGRDWRLTELSVQHPEARFSAQGNWLAATRRTELNWTLDIDNSGRWLDTLGFANTVRGGKGELKGKLGWRGSPLSPTVQALEGRFSVQIGGGQFLKADPGAARLLGILSLQSLPRRLFFDWRDVFSDGFAFDDFAGDVQVEQGVAQTRNLRMRGLQASVLTEGHADLRAETTDLRLLIVPNLDTGGAALAYAAINPAVGLTAFLAQLVLRRPVAAAGTTQLHVSGPWADPKVVKLDKPEPPNPESKP